jgi:hypothetical protein
MRIGVVVSAEQYMAKFGGGGGAASGGVASANPHHVQQVHSYRKGENPLSQAADVTSFYQRGGMSSYKKPCTGTSCHRRTSSERDQAVPVS